VIDQRRHTTVTLVDAHLDDAIVHGPGIAVIGQRHRIVDRDFGHLRQCRRGRLRCGSRFRRSYRLRFDRWLHFGGRLRHYAVCQNYCQGKNQRYEEETNFGHDANLSEQS
jgi:hypothetical protein